MRRRGGEVEGGREGEVLTVSQNVVFVDFLLVRLDRRRNTSG